MMGCANIFRTISLLLFVLFFMFGYGQKNAPTKPRNYVTDDAAVLSPAQCSSLNSKLKQFEDSTTNQLFIYIDKSLEGKDIESFSQKLFTDWKIGQSGKDNGVLIAIFTNDRKFRIQTGYGLEGVLPDLITKKIQDEFMAPHFKEQNYFKGLDEGIDELIATINGEHVYNENEEPSTKKNQAMWRAVISICSIIGFYLGAFFLMRKYKGKQRNFFYIICCVVIVVYFIKILTISEQREASFIRDGIAILGIAIFIYALTYRGICQKNKSPKVRLVFYVLAFLIFLLASSSVIMYVTNTLEDEFRGRDLKEPMERVFKWMTGLGIGLLGVVSLWNGNWELGGSSGSGSDSGSSGSSGGFSGGGGGRSGGGGSSSDW